MESFDKLFRIINANECRNPIYHIATEEQTEILKTTTEYYRINRREISFLRFIFEAYDGLAVISTVDAKQGIISVTTAPGCRQETETILKGLKDEIMIEKVDFLSSEGYEFNL